MDEKGQGAIEYLLIIGAAVIIAVIVIALMMTLSQQGTTAADDANIDGTYSDLIDQKDTSYGSD
jgi:Flp pilus assembly pilin Flp